jgi:SAM-dependent methyltransferase
VSLLRAKRAREKRVKVACGDGYHLPFPSQSFSVVLLVAVIEHTSRPWDVLQEARRVLKPGGVAVIVVPNDVTMSVGRLLLRKFPIRYPDHLSYTTPGRMKRWLSNGFKTREAFTLPFRKLPYMTNLFYFVVAEKTS